MEKWAEHRSQEIKDTWRKSGPNVIKAGVGFASVIVAILISLFAVVWLVGVISLLTTGALFGFIFVGIPLWVAILIITFAYHVATLPLRAFRNESYAARTYEQHHYGAQNGWSDMWDAMMWFVFFALLGWVLWTFVPYTHELWESFSRWFVSVTQP